MYPKPRWVQRCAGGPLEAKWAQVSTDKAVEVLGHKDVTVTNLKDKLSLLKKLPELEGVYAIIVQEMPSHVQEQMAEEQREAAEASDQIRLHAEEVAKLKEQLSFHKSLSMPVTEREKVRQMRQSLKQRRQKRQR